ncbi:hypothetical protein [Pseudoalteromonas arctica]|uniref:AraC family transcriptional regulator n=1 Tax=Pseudoalteromonas arctica TaxID=394751 RepID=A0A7Y0DRT4_9GAMM|nr:hypothetical protein [Pseudoalteromonas arctica]NMM40376.1 hypothetical protein [Pseudoalteromonas arctica]
MAILLLNDPLPHLKFQKFLPDQRLADWVQCYWKIGSPIKQTALLFNEKLYPDAGASLTIDLSHDHAHFCHAFHNFTFETPRQYRKRKTSKRL